MSRSSCDGAPPIPEHFAGRGRRRLLVVDDQPVNVRALYEVFQAEHEVIMATSGARALQLCRENLPDLILLDVVMPEMDGIEVCRQLKAEPATCAIPVLFVTAQDSAEDETRGLEAGAVDFITKPFNPAVVRARVGTHLTLKAQTDFLRSLAFVDGLTGVANRRQFDERYELEWRACRRNRSPLTVVMIDVDHFKEYNDRYGHEKGDECLKAVASVLRQAAGRGRDLIARYGGEEFVALMPETDLAGARAQAETFRQDVEALQIPHAGSRTASVVTISIGVAAAVPTANSAPRELLAAADARLYGAKQNGRNRIESAGPAA